MGHFYLIAIPKEELKILWRPIVVYYGKNSLLVDVSKIIIHLILTHSSILYLK